MCRSPLGEYGRGQETSMILTEKTALKIENIFTVEDRRGTGEGKRKYNVEDFKGP